MPIDIDNLTVKELRDLSSLACTVAGAKKVPPKSPHIGKKVIVRTVNAGVFFGTLRRKSATEVSLDGARRIWNWYGANTCSELALTGLDSARSRVGEPVDGHEVSGWIEILPCADDAAKKIEVAKWAK